jgi:hypothetical protein
LCHAPGAKVGWVSLNNGNVPSNAVGPVGGEGTFIGRAHSPGENKETPGKIFPKWQKLFICYDGKEHEFTSYEGLSVHF